MDEKDSELEKAKLDLETAKIGLEKAKLELFALIVEKVK